MQIREPCMAHSEVEDLQDRGHIWFSIMVPGINGPKQKEINTYKEEEKEMLVIILVPQVDFYF